MTERVKIMYYDFYYWVQRSKFEVYWRTIFMRLIVSTLTTPAPGLLNDFNMFSLGKVLKTVEVCQPCSQQRTKD